MKILAITSLLFLLLSNFSNSQSGWYLIQPINDSLGYGGVYFIDEHTGFACGGIMPSNGIILRTTNTGLNWIRQIFSPNSVLSDVFFPNSSIGYSVGYHGKVCKTTNSGESWVEYTISTDIDLRALYFTDSIIGYTVGNPGIIMKTINGGINWFEQLSYPSFVLSSVFFVNEQTGYACGFRATNDSLLCIIFKTTNSGSYWNNLFYGSDFILKSLCFADVNIGFAVGSGKLGSNYPPKIIKTTNSGNNWFHQNPNINFPLNAVKFVNASTGYAIGGLGSGSSVILKTTNSGINWYSQNTGVIFELGSAFFINSQTGYVVGGNGVILKTTNGGGPIGIQPISGQIPVFFSLSQNYPNPFNPSTKIKFDLPKSSFTKLIVYDALGREITTLVNEELKPGSYEVEFDGSNYPSGVYFCKLIAGDYINTKKMILIK